MVMGEGKRSKSPNEVKPLETINKNPQSFLKISLMQMKPLLYINCKIMHMRNRILTN